VTPFAASAARAAFAPAAPCTAPPGWADKQLQLRMGQANVHRWVPDILPLLTDDDPLGVDTFATHRVPLEGAPDAYANFQHKRDGTVTVLLRP